MIRSVHQLSCILLICPAHIHSRVLTCSITCVTLDFSLTQVFVFLSRYVMFNISFLSLSVWLLACSLLRWCVPMFPWYMSLLEVPMSCRIVFSSMFPCYPWRCCSAWQMLSIWLWFFFESPCLGFCFWWCISVPGRCSIHRSRSEHCWHILVCHSFLSPLSSTCFSSDSDFHFHHLILVAFVVVHVVY